MYYIIILLYFTFFVNAYKKDRYIIMFFKQSININIKYNLSFIIINVFYIIDQEKFFMSEHKPPHKNGTTLVICLITCAILFY